MKPKELLIVSVVYLTVASVAFLIGLKADSDDAAGLPQFTATFCSVFVAIWLYQSRNSEVAPAKVKLTVSFTLTVVAIVHGLLFQRLFKWMVYPDVSLFFATAGSFVIPFIFWNNFAKGFIASHKK
jgi:hypothetical protein